MFKKVALISVVLLTVGACQNDPYKGKGDLQDPKKPKDTPTKPVDKVGRLSLFVDNIMNFNEGSPGQFKVQATVPVGGVLMIETKDLPPGMVYDSATMLLKWTPNYLAANDPNDPNKNMRTYPIEVKAYDSNDPTEQKVIQALVIVNDTQRPAGVKSNLEILGIEGSPVAHMIEFEDQEFPTGPFSVNVTGLPLDATVDYPNPSLPRFILRWTPTYDKVVNKLEDVYTGHVTINNPRGKRLDFNVVWTIANRIAPPLVGGPVDVTDSVNVSFAVIAEDQNGEFIPQWSGVNPGYGTLVVTTQAVPGGIGRPKSAGVVNWTNIPVDKLGKLVTMNLRACVGNNSCTSHQVRVMPNPSVLHKEQKK